MSKRFFQQAAFNKIANAGLTEKPKELSSMLEQK
jgi:hypothetical protein